MRSRLSLLGVIQIRIKELAARSVMDGWKAEIERAVDGAKWSGSNRWWRKQWYRAGAIRARRMEMRKREG